ncbi:hypothetical protein M0R01_02490 [bacterium]|nr:hypothetical protein [bacterium]
MHIADSECSSIKDIKNVEIYLAVFSGEKILIYRPKQSSSQEQDLWKIPSYYSDICSIDSNYIDAIMSEANKTLMDNVCMEFGPITNYELVPVWLEEGNVKELSFVITIPCETLKISSVSGVLFPNFSEGVVKKRIGFFSEESIQNLEVDPKSKTMITKIFSYHKA